MTHINRSALLPYSAERIYQLVNDIARYPEFMEGCIGATILHQADTVIEARLVLSKGGIRQQFATRNLLVPYEKISLQLLEGPFDSLQGEWLFKSLAADACKVSLDLRFQMQQAIAQRAAEKLFEQVASNLVGSLCQRANKLYG